MRFFESPEAEADPVDDLLDPDYEESITDPEGEDFE